MHKTQFMLHCSFQRRWKVPAIVRLDRAGCIILIIRIPASIAYATHSSDLRYPPIPAVTSPYTALLVLKILTHHNWPLSESFFICLLKHSYAYVTFIRDLKICFNA